MINRPACGLMLTCPLLNVFVARGIKITQLKCLKRFYMRLLTINKSCHFPSFFFFKLKGDIQRRDRCTFVCVVARSASSSISWFLRILLFPLLFPSSYLRFVNKSDQTFPSLLAGGGSSVTAGLLTAAHLCAGPQDLIRAGWIPLCT